MEAEASVESGGARGKLKGRNREREKVGKAGGTDSQRTTCNKNYANLPAAWGSKTHAFLDDPLPTSRA